MSDLLCRLRSILIYGVSVKGLGACSPMKFFKLGTLRSLLRPCLGQKKTTRIVVSVAREAIEPNCQK